MKIGVLGLGSIGVRHYLNATKLGHEVWGYDPDGGVMPSSDREYVLDKCDAIVICSPSKEHSRDIQDALRRGLHVLCEKPFGYDCPSFLNGFIKAQRELSDVIVATGFNLRFHKCVKKAKELIPEIGDILFAQFTVFQKTERPMYLRDGILRNWCSHEIDLANHLLGPGGQVLNCTCPIDDGEDRTEAYITMKYPSVKETVFIQADYYSDPERRYFFIEGTKGGIYVDLVARNVFRSDTATGKKWHVLAASDSFDENYLDEMMWFTRSAATGHHYAPLATAEDGITALYQVMDARRKAGL